MSNHLNHYLLHNEKHPLIHCRMDIEVGQVELLIGDDRIHATSDQLERIAATINRYLFEHKPAPTAKVCEPARVHTPFIVLDGGDYAIPAEAATGSTEPDAAFERYLADGRKPLPAGATDAEIGDEMMAIAVDFMDGLREDERRDSDRTLDAMASTYHVRRAPEEDAR